MIGQFFKQSEKSSFLPHLLVFLFFVLLTIVVTYPFITRMTNYLPGEGDPFLTTWILSWDVKKITSLDFNNFFDTNIFYPHALTLAYSENFLALSLIVLPVIVISNNPVLAYNLLVLLSFILAAFGVYLLVFYYTKNTIAAILAGIFFGFAPFKYLHNFGHLHASGWCLPYLVLAWEVFIKKPGFQRGLLIILFIFLFIGSSLYFSAFLPFLSLIFFLVKYLGAKDESIKRIVKNAFIITILTICIVGLIITLPYLKLSQQGFFRTHHEVNLFSPGILNYFISPLIFPANFEQEWLVSPGWVIIILFLLSIGLLLTRQSRQLYQTREKIILYGFLALFAFVMSLGFKFSLWSWQDSLVAPFYFLYHFIPGYNSLRGLGRFSVYLLFSFSIIIGCAFSCYLKRFNKNWWQKIINAFLILIALMFFLVEVLIIAPPNYVKARPIPEVYDWVKKQPENIIFLELPLFYSTSIQIDYLYVYSSTYHWHKLVNGCSGYQPVAFDYFQNKVKDFSPISDYEIIKNYQADYLIIHFDYYSLEEQERIRLELEQNPNYQLVKQFGNDFVYEIM